MIIIRELIELGVNYMNMYRELNFFKNMIKMFFICEAPGMWVHSTMDYFKRYETKTILESTKFKNDIALTKLNYYIITNGDITKVNI